MTFLALGNPSLDPLDDIVNARDPPLISLAVWRWVPSSPASLTPHVPEVRCTFWCPIARLDDDLGSRTFTLCDLNPLAGLSPFRLAQRLESGGAVRPCIPRVFGVAVVMTSALRCWASHRHSVRLCWSTSRQRGGVRSWH